MKVAHHFSGGSGSLKRTRPARDDRASFANAESIWCLNSIIRSSLRDGPILWHANPALKCRATFTESLWDGPVLWHTNPALKCWATFTESLRDDSLCIRNKGFSCMGYSPDPPRSL